MKDLVKQWDVISRYLAGESTGKEARKVDKWIHADPENRKEMEYLQNMWKASDRLEIQPGETADDPEVEWERLAAKMQSLELAERSKKRRSSRPNAKKARRITHFGYILRVAAIITLMLGAGVFISQWLYEADLQDRTENRITEFSTRTSQLSAVELLDGSKVNLSVKSSVRLSDGYYQGSREVFLQGHAYFDVITDPSEPFVVRVEHADIKALGTDFTVRAYPEDERVQVVVMNGRVSVTPTADFGSNRSEIILKPGDRALLDKDTGEVTVSEVNTANYLRWIEGRIVFEENTLAEVARELQRWFGIEFVIQEEALKSRKMTAVLDSQSLSNVLDVIGKTLDVSYQFEENRIHINVSS